MGFVPTLNSFVAGTPIVASEVNSNFAKIVGVINGGINHENIVNGGITTELLAAGSVTTSKLADSSVDGDKIAIKSISASHIIDESISSSLLAPLSVTSSSLSDGSVTTVKLGDSSVTTAKVADNAVTPPKLSRIGHRVITSDETLSLSDMDSTVVVDSSSQVRVTVPSDNAQPIPVGSVIEVLPYGDGPVLVTPDSGVTLRSVGGRTGTRTSAEQLASLFLRKLDADEWVLQGLML